MTSMYRGYLFYFFRSPGHPGKLLTLLIPRFFTSLDLLGIFNWAWIIELLSYREVWRWCCSISTLKYLPSRSSNRLLIVVVPLVAAQPQLARVHRSRFGQSRREYKSKVMKILWLRDLVPEVLNQNLLAGRAYVTVFVPVGVCTGVYLDMLHKQQ